MDLFLLDEGKHWGSEGSRLIELLFNILTNDQWERKASGVFTSEDYRTLSGKEMWAVKSHSVCVGKNLKVRTF